MEFRGNDCGYNWREISENPNGEDYNGNKLPEWKAYNSKEKSVMKDRKSVV